MIETGTAHSLPDVCTKYAQEPVLRQVLAHIRNDEINHYKHFLQYFRVGPAARRKPSTENRVGHFTPRARIARGRRLDRVPPRVRGAQPGAQVSAQRLRSMAISNGRPIMRRLFPVSNGGRHADRPRWRCRC